MAQVFDCVSDVDFMMGDRARRVRFNNPIGASGHAIAGAQIGGIGAVPMTPNPTPGAPPKKPTKKPEINTQSEVQVNQRAGGSHKSDPVGCVLFDDRPDAESIEKAIKNVKKNISKPPSMEGLSANGEKALQFIKDNEHFALVPSTMDDVEKAEADFKKMLESCSPEDLKKLQAYLQHKVSQLDSRLLGSVNMVNSYLASVNEALKSQ